MLAREVGCTTRTIRRDLDALELTGFPLYTEEIDGESRWMMMNAFKHAPSIPFTLTELLSLYFSRDLLKVLKGTPFYESIESILDKIRKTISPETLEHLAKLEQSFYVAQKKAKDYGRYKAFLDQLIDATAQSKTVEIKYHTMHSDKITVRKVDPYKMWYFDNTFFLIGRCHRNDDVRMFVVDRIKSMKILTESFRVPSDFSVEDYMRDSFGVIHGKKVQVVVRFDKEVAGYIKEKKWHSSQNIKQHKNGSITATFTIAGTNEIKYWILSYGHRAEVLKPASLREEIKADLLLALKRY